jgi:prevent-host-death family protein
MSRVTAKELHLQTKSILDQSEKGESLIVTRNGRPVARLEPLSRDESIGWEDVMGEVWAAQTKVKASDRVTNPVLEERARRRR